jgi:hypothetical protein
MDDIDHCWQRLRNLADHAQTDPREQATEMSDPSQRKPVRTRSTASRLGCSTNWQRRRGLGFRCLIWRSTADGLQF